jgi:tRNA-Thr(GGU) m(6)t(6)A37 methyltransferase TsaA
LHPDSRDAGLPHWRATAAHGGCPSSGGIVTTPFPAPDMQLLTLEPIGRLRTALGSKVEAARQPRAAEGTQGTIELLPGRNFEHALEDLAGWEYIWVVFWFHLNRGWRPKVLPPRSVSGRKGVFSTRSPHRPNPIGLSVVRLDRVDGLILHVRDVDILDGTPVLDIKPYVAYTDAHPAARSGWLGDSAPPEDPVATHEVSWSARASAQAAWIEVRTGMPLRERIIATLALGAAPHPYRRIRRVGDEFRLAIKEWRARFTVTGREIHVLEIQSGYRAAELVRGSAIEPTRAHCEFLALWPRDVQEPGQGRS